MQRSETQALCMWSYHCLSGFKPSSSLSSPHRISARKLTVALWECTRYLASFRMHHHNGSVDDKPLGLCCLRKAKDGSRGGGGGGFELSHFLANPSPSSPDQVHVGFSIKFYYLGL